MMTLVELSGISKRYGHQVALDEVTLSIAPGETVGLIGANGAGKTTLLRVTAGLLRPTSGHVCTDSGVSPVTIRYFGGERTMPPGVTVGSWLAMWGSGDGTPAAKRRLGILSRGTRQRIGLEAMLASNDTKLVLLDEPWEGLDPDASRWLTDTLLAKRAAGAGVVVSSHRIHDLADVCDRCLFLINGRLSAEIVRFDHATVERADRSALLFEAFDRARGRS